MAELQIFEDAISEIAARLDLREPNREAVQTINAAVSQYYDVEAKLPPFEAVIDSATGVGKTYILIGAMELFVQAYGVRDFVIIAPGRTILQKTIDNLTPGHQKSLLGPMSFQPVVITADNFATPTMRAAMDDDTQIKVYIFTVQSLIKPESKAGRKTHKFQEGLGTEFYSHLQNVPELVVFADEHHTYYGPSFSKAVRDLTPWVLLGLTATPDKKTPAEEIIFRYPLAAAIADQLVKTPVIVGRKDDRVDPLTKLTDGITLLNAKEEAVAAYCAATGAEPVAPVMLVVAKSIEDANEYGDILKSSEFFSGAFADAVLVVHSKAPDEALEELAKVEDADSPVRVIISVGMLKEGWDVRNVYVIASMRASVSDILTEQTLGRGMRLPFGKYTGIEILDTLEVVAHERYEDLLKKAGVLNQAFVDYRTWAALRTDSKGQTVVVSQTIEAGTIPIVSATDGAPEVSGSTPPADGASTPVLISVQQRTDQVDAAATRMKVGIVRRPDAPAIVIPVLRMSAIESTFTLSDITDLDPFRKLGAALAANPDGELSRTLFSARIVTGPDGMKRTELIRSSAADHIRSAPTLFAIDQLTASLVDLVLASPAVPARANQRKAVMPLILAFLKGLGEKADEVLSANLGRAGARLVKLVADEQRRYMSKPSYHEVVELREFNPTRATDKPFTADRLGPFRKTDAYEGWERAIFPAAWFDSEPERRVANMVDADKNVLCWDRLLLNDLPILWNSDGKQYNPDLIVVDKGGAHWVVEVKMDKEMQSEDVQGKRDAAKRWANYVNDDPSVTDEWHYLLVSETDIKDAKGSWEALKKLGS